MATRPIIEIPEFTMEASVYTEEDLYVSSVTPTEEDNYTDDELEELLEYWEYLYDYDY